MSSHGNDAKLEQRDHTSRFRKCNFKQISKQKNLFLFWNRFEVTFSESPASALSEYAIYRQLCLFASADAFSTFATVMNVPEDPVPGSLKWNRTFSF